LGNFGRGGRQGRRQKAQGQRHKAEGTRQKAKGRNPERHAEDPSPRRHGSPSPLHSCAFAPCAFCLLPFAFKGPNVRRCCFS
jgi:hypothetical protein